MSPPIHAHIALVATGRSVVLLLTALIAGWGVPVGHAADSSPLQEEDPLRNTRRLVIEGHRTLYDNGAFQVPFTTLKLIPPGPTREDLFFDLARRNARQSFLLSVEQAMQATRIVADGTRYSYEVATNIHRGTAELVAAIQAHMRPRSKLIGYNSYLLGMGIRGRSWEASQAVGKGMEQAGSRIAEVLAESGEGAAEVGAEWIAASPEFAMAIIASGIEGGERLELQLDDSAVRLAAAMDVDGETIRLAGAARLLTLPRTVAQADVKSAESAAEVDSVLRNRARRLADAGARAGEDLAATGAATTEQSPETGRTTYEAAAGLADRMGAGSREAVRDMEASLRTSGRSVAEQGTLAGMETQQTTKASAIKAYQAGTSAAAATLAEGGQQFVLGYAALPGRLEQHVEEVQVRDTFDSLAESVGEHTNWLSERSDHFLGIIHETFDTYSKAVQLKLDRAGQEFDAGLATAGVSFASLKALRWVLEGLLWDGAVRPVGTVGGAALGYLAVGGAVYPALVTYEAGKSTLHLAVQVTRSVGGGAYDVVAPTGEAALAGVLAVAQSTAGTGQAIAVGAGGGLVGAGQMAGSQVVGATMEGLGTTLGAATEYVAVPLAQGGLHVGGGVAGVVAGTVSMAAGTGLMATGQVVKVSSAAAGAALEYVGAPLAAAAVRAGGTGAGVARGVYDEVTGVVLYSTGGVVQGMALATERSIKYGVSPAADLAVAGSGMAVGAGAVAGKATAGTVVYLWGQVVKGAGIVGGRTIEHAAAPVTMAGIAGVGVTADLATEAAGGIGAAVTGITGEAAAATTWLFGNALAGATLVGGTGVSTAYGAGVGLYEVASSMVVPVGHVGGAGIVLSYKSLSHLAAHSVLAVADASYLVLSLEGPRWVIYAVQGKLGNGSELPEGTVVDLGAMDRNGERFYNVPVSHEEMGAVIRSVQEELPSEPGPRKTPQDPPPPNRP